MGGYFSRSSYVWIRTQRFRFNSLQASDSYYKIFSLGGWRRKSGQRVTTYIMSEILQEKIEEATAKRDTAKRDYDDAREEEMEMFSNSKKKMTAKNKTEFLKYKDSLEGAAMYKKLALKSAEVARKKLELRHANADLKEKLINRKQTMKMLDILQESSGKEVNFNEWAKTMVKVSGDKLQLATIAEDNSATQQLTDNLMALDDLEMEKYGLDEEEDDEISEDDLTRISRLLTSDTAMTAEFMEVKETEENKKKKRVAAKTKNKSNSVVMVEDDEEDILYSSPIVSTVMDNSDNNNNNNNNNKKSKKGKSTKMKALDVVKDDDDDEEAFKNF